MKELIGKRFELSGVVEENKQVVGLTLIGDDEVVRLEAVEPFGSDYTGNTAYILASIEPLIDPLSEEVKTDVFGGAFVAQ